MTWSRHHSASEILAALAEVAKKSGRYQRALELYHSAAEAEEEALNATSPDKPRTLGVTAVSAASLYFEANLFKKSKRLAEQWRKNKNVPAFAVEELNRIVEIASAQIKNQLQNRTATAKPSFKASLGSPIEDRQADLSWADLFNNFYKRLYFHAARLTGGHTERADDLVQDTFVLILHSSYRPNELKAPLAYVFRIMRNVLTDQARKANRVQFESLDDPNVELQEQFLRFEPSIQRELERKELIASSLKSPKLSPREKLLLELIVTGKDSKEISHVLNEDIRIIRADINALRAKLKYRLKHSKNG